MPLESSPDVTRLLVAWSSGDLAARDQLIPIVYNELRKLASLSLRRQYIGHSLQTTVLVNEVYLRLVNYENVQWQDRAHFFALAANIIRGILVDHFRSYTSLKRGGNQIHLSLDEVPNLTAEWGEKFLPLNEALSKFEAIAPRQCKIVELRFFAGLTVEEIAEVLKVSTKTVKREWSTARAWLEKELTR